MFPLCLVWCTFVVLSDHFSSAATFWWSLNWSLNRSLTVVNPFPKQVLLASLLKTLLEKEKLLITSNFPFSHSVFYAFGELSAIFIRLTIVVYKLFQFGKVWNLLFGKGSNKIPIILFLKENI